MHIPIHWKIDFDGGIIIGNTGTDYASRLIVGTIYYYTYYLIIGRGNKNERRWMECEASRVVQVYDGGCIYQLQPDRQQ